MDQLLLDPLNNITTSLTSLTNSLTTTNTFAAAPAATQSLLTADDALSSALATLKKHQDNYAHILELRSEALHLEEQIKDTIRQCNVFTSEIKEISPVLLEDSDSEDEVESKGEVDYNTLLILASRIATYNTTAQREAETLLQRTKREALSNGNGEVHVEPGVDIIAVTDAEVARDRAMKGMAFPDAEILRLGALGRLQVIREQRGEEAVDEEVERLMMESEGYGMAREENDVRMEVKNDIPQEMRTRRAIQIQRSAPPQPQQQQEKKKVNLDLWAGEDDDD